MASKADLQTQLKDLYKINKNISEPLTRDECEAMLLLLAENPSALKIVETFVNKNSSLGKNNTVLGGQRSRAERRFETLQSEYDALEISIADLESTTNALNQRKLQLEADRSALSREIEQIGTQNKALSEKVGKLNVLTDELTDANDQLKKENKALKNLMDAIRLRLAKDVKQLLNYDDSEIRKALIKVFKSTLG